MNRIQIQLTGAQEKSLKDMARLRGVSISALIREGVDLVLQPHRQQREAALARAAAVIGAFDSGLTDVSERHDHYLAKAYAGDEPT